MSLNCQTPRKYLANEYGSAGKSKVPPYTHSNHEIPRPLFESKGLRHGYGAEKGHQCLNCEDDGYHCQLAKFVSRELGSKLRKNCLSQRELPIATPFFDVLRHGVNSMTLRLAANFCISALNMP